MRGWGEWRGMRAGLEPSCSCSQTDGSVQLDELTTHFQASSDYIEQLDEGFILDSSC